MLERFRVPATDAIRVTEAALRRTVTDIFIARGVQPEDAAGGVEVLVMADPRGVESHGVTNTLRSYVTNFRTGRCNARPRSTIVQESASAAMIDGDRGLGVLLGARPPARRRSRAASTTPSTDPDA